MCDWNGAGCQTNFSTLKMRAPGGVTFTEKAMGDLQKIHEEAMKKYDPDVGKDNLRHEPSSAGKFFWGVDSHGCSIRISRQVSEDGMNYLENRRRASSNCDPFQVTTMIVKSVLL